MTVAPPIPILRNFDAAKAREFHVDFPGFGVLFEHRFEAGTPLPMGLRLGDCLLHLSEHHGDACPGSAVRIELEDVDACCAELGAKRYRCARPGVQEQPWGYCEMAIDDPARNRLIFCTESPA